MIKRLKTIGFFIIVMLQGFTFSDANAYVEKKDGDACVVFFSVDGHTKFVAKLIANTLELPLLEIVPDNPYTSDDINYRLDGCRALAEKNDKSSRPKIRNDLSIVSKYKKIILGSPVWFRQAPRIMQTFIEKYGLYHKKELYMFVTSGGTPIFRYVSKLKEDYPDINIVESKRFRSETEPKDVVEWAESLR